MGGQYQSLQCPAEASGQLFLFYPRKEFLHLQGTPGMVNILYLGDHHGGIAGEIRFDTYTQVDEALTCHGSSSISLAGIRPRKSRQEIAYSEIPDTIDTRERA
jgi:hypothetical protein